MVPFGIQVGFEQALASRKDQIIGCLVFGLIALYVFYSVDRKGSFKRRIFQRAVSAVVFIFCLYLLYYQFASAKHFATYGVQNSRITKAIVVRYDEQIILEFQENYRKPVFECTITDKNKIQ